MSIPIISYGAIVLVFSKAINGGRICTAASRGFSLAWLLGFTRSFAWLVCRAVGLITLRRQATRITSYAIKTMQERNLLPTYPTCPPTPPLSQHFALSENRPFPSSKKSHFQNEAKCETFVVEMSFICIIIENHFHINGFALSLALKVRCFGTRKWPNLSVN